MKDQTTLHYPLRPPAGATTMGTSPVSYPASCTGLVALCIGLIMSTATTARAQLSQRNTNATRPADAIADAQLFGGLNAERNEDGTLSAPSSPGDADLGDQVVFQPSTQYHPLSVSLQAEGSFTSNAGLTDTDELEDFYLYSELDLRYIPRLTDTVSGSFSAKYGVYRYNDHSALDFDSFETSAGLMKVFSDLHDLVVWGNYNYTRLAEARGGHDELLADHSLELGLYFPFRIREDHFAFASYLSSFSIGGDPDLARRDEHGLTLGYAYLPIEQVELSAYYQIFFYDYIKDGRHDLLQDIGLGLEWTSERGISVGLRTSYSINDSNAGDGDYIAGEVGAAVTLTLQF